MRSVKIAAACVVAAFLLVGCSTAVKPPGVRATTAPSSSASAAPAEDTFSVLGHLTLTTGWVPAGINDGCAGTDGYDDIREGQQIVVIDGSGATQALGSLYSSSVDGTSCVFTFSVPGVPKGLSFYSFKLGSRGAPQYTESQMEAGPELSLG